MTRPTPTDPVAGIAAAARSARSGPRKRTLAAFAVGSFLMVAPYALARATRNPPVRPEPRPKPAK